MSNCLMFDVRYLYVVCKNVELQMSNVKMIRISKVKLFDVQYLNVDPKTL